MGGVCSDTLAVRCGQVAGRVKRVVSLVMLVVIVVGSWSPTQTETGAEQLGLLLAVSVVVAAAPGKIDLLVGDDGAAAIDCGVAPEVGSFEAGK